MPPVTGLREGARVEGVRKIAVLRANALGDLMFSLPALGALAATYPEAEVVLLGAPWHRDFLFRRPGPVDRVEVVPPLPGVREGEVEPGEEEDFRRRMRAEELDLALQWHGGGRHSNPLVSSLGARVTAGSATPDAPRLDRTLTYVYFQSEYIRYLELAALVGAAAVPATPELALLDADREEAAPYLAGAPVAVLHPGASDPRRRWPPASFAAVGDALAAAGFAVAVTGTVPERGLVDGVLGAMHAPARDFCDVLSLGGLAGLLAGAAVVVSNDSGPLHLAQAVGCPTVGIFWAYNITEGAPLARARHRPLCSYRMHCPECGTHVERDFCPHEVSFVADVDPERVAAVALELTGRGTPDSAALAHGLDPRAHW